MLLITYIFNFIFLRPIILSRYIHFIYVTIICLTIYRKVCGFSFEKISMYRLGTFFKWHKK